MSGYAESRVSEKIHGPTKTSLGFYSNNCSEVNSAKFQRYAIAAKAPYAEGEPENLTKARNELRSAYQVVMAWRQMGIPAMFPPHIEYALRVSGWVK